MALPWFMGFREVHGPENPVYLKPIPSGVFPLGSDLKGRIVNFTKYQYEAYNIRSRRRAVRILTKDVAKQYPLIRKYGKAIHGARNRYSVEEARVLQDIVVNHRAYVKTWYMMVMAGELENIKFKIARIGADKELVWTKPTFDFMFMTPFEDVPLFVSDESLESLAQWRLQIGR